MSRDNEYVPESGEAAFAMRAGEMDPFAPFGAQFTSTQPEPAKPSVIVIDLCETNPQAEMSQM